MVHGENKNELSSGLLYQMVQQIDDKHEDAHHRLRDDYRSLEGRVTALESARVSDTVRFTKLETAPLDVTKINFTTRTVAAVVLAAIAVVSSQLAMNASLKAELLKALEISVKAQDERDTNLKASIEMMQRRQESQEYEIKRLSEAVTRISLNGARR